MKEQSKEKKSISKKLIVAIVASLILMMGFAVLYFLYIKPKHESAIVAYSKTVEEYTAMLSKFDAMCEKYGSENERLDTEIVDLQDTVTYGGEPYDKNLIVLANDVINQGKIAKKDVPTLDFEKKVKSTKNFFFLQIGSVTDENHVVKEKIEKLNKLIEETEIPDYSEVTTKINEAQINLENSIRQLKQVTSPSETFVLGRIMEIKKEAGMIDVIALTEDTDTENLIGKNGWYTSKVIFRHKDVKDYGIEHGLTTLAETGNPAGGCVETYTSVKDAERRNEELASMEGTVRSPGAHFVCGTMVVRVSEDMKTSTQKKLMKMIVEALLRLEE